MGSRLGKRVINFTNLPIKLLMPSSFDHIKEIALKTIPSASKIEIRRVLESLYGFEVEEVRTLNMEGKKKKRGGILIAKPDYKKAYVTLKHPLSLSQDLFPIRMIQEDKKATDKQPKSSIVEEGGEVKSHWLDGQGTKRYIRPGKQGYARDTNPNFKERRSNYRGGQGSRGEQEATSKFPWSNMRSASPSK
ncbi:39S ribosomal protein L23, mitochondrial-like [Papaver somniferum]|uniref:39S ribosomal protein L23, mitochondrial-like n=1 Tax=Papaver somniferum TaxID=3469 RepID=UPI000E6FAFB4|nr:39S ribosomal protein L23, mitochondrial-like [Papaver somniferum]